MLFEISNSVALRNGTYTTKFMQREISGTYQRSNMFQHLLILLQANLIKFRRHVIIAAEKLIWLHL